MSETESIGHDDPGQDMIAVLKASGPHSALGMEARLFDKFVGTWDLDSIFYAADGKQTHLVGDWRFGWILQGRMIQDVFTLRAPAGSANSGGDWLGGTSLRVFNNTSKRWEVVYVGAISADMVRISGGAVGDRIVLEGLDVDGSQIRWSFNNIEPARFVWRGEISKDGGKTWRLEQQMTMRRRAPSK